METANNSTGDGLSNSHATSLETAQRYIDQGLSVIPIPHGRKNPAIKEWQKLRITETNAHEFFNGKPQNFGVLLGEPSGNLIDIDLDCAEAVKLAPFFLPKPHVTFGRASKPHSHYLYRCEITQKKFKAPDGKMLLELRSTGGQTVFPGSTHPSGETIEWNIEGTPPRVTPVLVSDAVARLAASAALAQAWRIATGSRHDLALAIAGGLARARWSQRDAEFFIVNTAGAAGDSELHDRLQAVRDTFAKGGDSNSTGWPRAAAIIGEKLVERIRQFLTACINIAAPAPATSATVAPANESAFESAYNDLPLIKANDRLPVEIADEALSILRIANDPPEFFVRSGKLIRVRVDENNKPLIETITDLHVREALGRVARFVNQGQKGYVTIYPPMSLVQDIRSRASWPGFPSLEAITETPTLRRDGSILAQAGYDSATRLIYHPANGFTMPTVPHQPTRDEVAQALAALHDVLCDFPFADDASRANAFALILTPIIRPLIDLAPLAVIDAPQAGTGKGKLTDLVSIIATGRPAAKGNAPIESDELEKKITAMLSAGSTFIVFDDVAQTLRSHVLASALTASEWTGRILGRSEMSTVPQRATWIATGNNMQLGGDIPRRCFWIRLDAKTARPYLRDGFRHPNLEGYTRENRGSLLAALLTLARAWHVAGCPRPTAKPLGSYEQWTLIIGGILETAGVTGFLANANDLYEQSDDDTAQWEIFVRACHEALGNKPVTIAELSLAAMRAPITGTLPDQLTEALMSNKGDFKKLLAKSLAKRAERRYGDEGFYVTRAGKDSHKNAVQWQFNKDE